MNIYEQVNSNKLATKLIVIIFILFFLFIGLGFDYYFGQAKVIPFFTIFAFLFGLVSVYNVYKHGDRFILNSAHAKELDLNDPKQKQWQNVVEEMSIASGITLPKTYIIDDADPNAFATGKNPKNSSIAVTKGLLELLNRDELQAVAAHEMSHIKNYDIRLMLIITVLIGSVALISDWTRRFLFRSQRSSNDRRRNSGAAGLIILCIWLVTVILAPVLSQLMAMFVSRKREYLADASGAELTRNPLALATALEKMDSQVLPTGSINQGTAHLCICDPKGSALGKTEGAFADLFATHPPIKRRIDALSQMAYTK